MLRVCQGDGDEQPHANADDVVVTRRVVNERATETPKTKLFWGSRLRIIAELLLKTYQVWDQDKNGIFDPFAG